MFSFLWNCLVNTVKFLFEACVGAVIESIVFDF